MNHSPEVLIQQQLSALINSGASDRCFAIAFVHTAYYLPEPTELPLLALMALSWVDSQVRVHGAILEDTPGLRQQLHPLSADPPTLMAFAADNHCPWLCFSAPLRLVPVYIPKPWGQEIWYTGIEARGQSAVGAQGLHTPLPWILSLLPDALASGRERDLILLKILDPLADEVYGDLYFEMHEQKQEVYIVTGVDERAWPTGEGAIRLGFDAAIRARYPDDDAFKQAYLQAVDAYRGVRATIDQLLDQERLAQGIGLSAPVDAQTMIAWTQKLPQFLVQEELSLRRQMDRFTALHPLRLGDVVKVPCRVPHALQHGVRTVEFQTPVYERKILSFAQKVLTQSGWDTNEALRNITLDADAQPVLEVVHSSQQLLIERVVMFEDFEVQRLSLSAHQSAQMDTANSYALLMLISGDLVIDSGGIVQTATDTVSVNEAFLLPAGGEPVCVVAGNRAAVMLLALPRAMT